MLIDSNEFFFPDHALLIRISRLPCFFSISPSAVSTLSGSVISSSTAEACTPNFSFNALAIELLFSWSLEPMTIFAPSSARASHIAVPRCPAPPVINTVLPLRLNNSCSDLDVLVTRAFLSKMGVALKMFHDFLSHHEIKLGIDVQGGFPWRDYGILSTQQ